MDTSTLIVASFLGGILPAVLWLEFWLRESRHRMPRRLILGTFVLGMFSTIAAGLLEKSVSLTLIEYTIASFFAWALIEELLKYACAYVGGLRSRFCDEPIDASIYLITSALGFAAAENVLFLSDALRDGDYGRGLASIADRFVGASLLHVVASGVIGIAIGISFYATDKVKKFAIIIGIIVSILLHTAFNSFIIIGDSNVFWVFSSTWIGLLVMILVLEKIKNTKRITRTS